MLTILLLLLIFFKTKKYKVSHLITLVYLISMFLALLLDYELIFKGELVPLHLLSTIFLMLVILPWRNVTLFEEKSRSFSSRDESLFKMLLVVMLIVMALNVYIFFNSFTIVANYSAFKNGGESTDFYKSLGIPHILILTSTYLSGLSIFLIPYHLYYFAKNKKIKTYLALFASLAYPIMTLQIFSRSGITQYALVYVFFILLFKNSLSKKQITKYLIVFSLIALSGLFMMSTITTNRFEDSLYMSNAESKNNKIENEILFSTFDYSSQWYRNNIYFEETYDGSTTKGYLTFSFFHYILNKIGVEDDYEHKLEVTVNQFYKHKKGAFAGVVMAMINDLGIFFFCVMLILYTKSISRIKRNYFSSYFLDATYVLIPLTGIFGSILNVVYWWVMLIFAYIFYKRSLKFYY